jgi:hypothetical protein
LLYQKLRNGDEVAVHTAMGLAKALQQMAFQATRGSQKGLSHWYERACELIAHLGGQEEDEEAHNGE